jgi:hypothetical protein
MRILLYPFFSQQDKRTGKFLLESDSGVKLYSYIASRAMGEGWSTAFVLPQASQCEDSEWTPPGSYIRYPGHLEQSNLDRRLQWDSRWLRVCADVADVILTQHEFLAYPLRCLVPNSRIVMECGIRPETVWPQTGALFPLAWDAADLVHCNSWTLTDEMRLRGVNASCWQFAVPEDVGPSLASKAVDVLFNSRASATGYTNHDVFLRAMEGTDLRVLVTDPTSYLRLEGGCSCDWLPPEPLDRKSYVEALQSSTVVVGLCNNGYGGYAFREAMAAGALPVALRAPEYEELLTPMWPYYAKALDPHEVYIAVVRALEGGWAGVPDDVRFSVEHRLRQSSYREAWRTARHDIVTVYNTERTC